MKINRENIRPAIIDQQLFSFLNNLRGFRHIVRHSYDYDLNFGQMQLVADDIEKNHEALVIKINEFIKFIHAEIKKIETHK